MLLKLFKNKVFLYFGEHGPELDYVIGQTITDLTNLKNSASGTQLSSKAITAVVVGWNYLDAVFDLMFAVSLFTNTSDYRYKQNIVKGVINVLEGVELFVLSYNPPLNAALGLRGDIALAGTAFALGMVGDLVIASIDFHTILKENNFPGWLDEQIKAYKYALAHGLETKDLVRDIRARCKAYIGGDPVKANAVNKLFKLKLSASTDKSPPIEELTKSLEVVTLKHVVRDQRIQDQLDETYRKSRTYLGIKITSMMGMALLAVAGLLDNSNNDSTNNSTNNSTNDPYSGTLTTGLALTTLVACYYFLINVDRLSNQVSTIYHRFFPAKKEIQVVELEELPHQNPEMTL